MIKEYCDLFSKNTWDLVPLLWNTNIVSSKWVFRHKLKPDGSLDRYKAHWVLRGLSQEQGIDFNKTFSLVVKLVMVHVILSITLSLKWETRQLDVKNGFLHYKLSKAVYNRQPIGFSDSTRPVHIYWLSRSLYGLKQAPLAWYQRFATFVTSIGFTCSRSDTSLYVLRCMKGMDFFLMHIDDIILTASSTRLLDQTIAFLRSEFAVTDMGSLHNFLGTTVTRDSSGMHLSQAKYAAEILNKFGMTACQSAMAPVDTLPKLTTSADPPVGNPTAYGSLIGAVHYLTFTLPDIAYTIQ
jgi:hypothetical protein